MIPSAYYETPHKSMVPFWNVEIPKKKPWFRGQGVFNIGKGFVRFFQAVWKPQFYWIRHECGSKFLGFTRQPLIMTFHFANLNITICEK